LGVVLAIGGALVYLLAGKAEASSITFETVIYLLEKKNRYFFFRLRKLG